MADFRSELVGIANQEFTRFAGRHELTPTSASILRDYWMNGAGTSQAAADKAIKDQTAWSAAFISWVVKKALHNSGSPAAFVFNSLHSVYAGAAIRNTLTGISSPAFFGLPPTGEGAVTPEVGDLIGVTRVQWIDDYADAMKAARKQETYYSHFDIVIEKRDDSIITIGGNVSDSVGKKKIALNNGFLPILPFKYNLAGKVISGPFICVIKYR